MKTKQYNTARIFIWGVYPAVLILLIAYMFFTCTNKPLKAENTSAQHENTIR